MVNLPRRLWASASKLDKSSRDKEKMPFPHEIRIETNANEGKKQRRHDREDVKYWKAKALALEGALEVLEEKVTALEKDSIGGKCSPCSPASASKTKPKSVEPTAELLSPKAKALPAPDGTSAPQPSPGKVEAEKVGEENKRKDEIMQQLVSEMERLIEFHALKIADEEDNEDADKKIAHQDKGVDQNFDGDKYSDKDDDDVEDSDKEADDDKDETTNDDANNTSYDTLTSRRPMNIETSKLEELVTKLLASEKAQCPPLSLSHKHKSHKKKHPRILYQLSCKRCIGQNFVGYTKNDVESRVKENYAMIWDVVRTAYGKGGGGLDVGERDQKDLEQGLSFRASSFAHHAAMHCKECDSEEEVYQWCFDNVKVEQISKHSIKRHG